MNRRYIVTALYFCFLLLAIALPAQLHAQVDVQRLIQEIKTYLALNPSPDTLAAVEKYVGQYRFVWTDSRLNELKNYKPKDQTEENITNKLKVHAQAKLEEQNRILDVLLKALELPYGSRYVQWIIEDDALIDEISQKLRFSDSRISEILGRKYYVIVFQDPFKDPDTGENELLQIFVGNQSEVLATLGGSKGIRTALGDVLYEKIRNPNTYPNKMRKPYYKPRDVANYLSADIYVLGIKVLANEAIEIGGISESGKSSKRIDIFGCKLEVGGKDIVGYPFWYGGSANFSFIWERQPYGSIDTALHFAVETGILFPFNPGETDMTLFGPIQFKHRRLNGSLGAIGRFEIGRWGSTLGLSGSYGWLKKKSSFRLLNVDGNPVENATGRFYYIEGNAHLYYSHDFSELFLEGLRGYVGVGYVRISRARLADGLNTVDVDAAYNQWCVYARLSYDHKVGTEYGVSFQYYDNLLLTSAYLKIFDWLVLEGKYIRDLRKDLNPWEDLELLVLSPRISFTFSY